MKNAHKTHRVTISSSLVSMFMCLLALRPHRMAVIKITRQSFKSRYYLRHTKLVGIPPISITSRHLLRPHSPFPHGPLTRHLIRLLCSVPIRRTQRCSNSRHILADAVFPKVHILLRLRPRGRIAVPSTFLWIQSTPRSREIRAPAIRIMNTARASISVVIFVGVLFIKLYSSMICFVSLFQIFLDIYPTSAGLVCDPIMLPAVTCAREHMDRRSLLPSSGFPFVSLL
jgi:hypothetical protein